MPTRIEVVYNHLDRVAAECIAREDQLSSAIAREIGRVAQNTAPVRTGALRRGITYEEGNPAVVTASSMDGGATREYALYNEYGTRFMRAQPFMMQGWAVGVSHLPIFGRTEYGVYIEAAA